MRCQISPDVTSHLANRLHPYAKASHLHAISEKHTRFGADFGGEPAARMCGMSTDLSWEAKLSFGDMVRQALGKAPADHVCEIRCPDVYVGRLADLPPQSKPDLLGRWQTADSDTARRGRPAGRCVVMVLESPHVDEFDPTHCYTPWPANGKTGYRLQSRALQLADLLGVPPDTGLVLLNAIPYQCSQVVSVSDRAWKERRDRVFVHVWAQEETRALFRARLIHWVQAGDVLVNACTAGLSRGPKLRDLVETEMADLFKGAVTRSRMHHPSGWYSAQLAAHLIPY